jgi:hypothetical protein
MLPFWLPLLLLLYNRTPKTSAASRTAPRTEPITMPAILPPERPPPVAELSLGDEVVVGVTVGREMGVMVGRTTPAQRFSAPAL